MPTVVGNVFGSERVTLASGMIVLGWSGGYLARGPIAGYLLSAFGGAEAGLRAFRLAVVYAGSMAVGAAGLVLTMRLLTERKLLEKV